MTVSCNAFGTPPLMVSWIKVDGHMTVSNGSELVFTNINRSEAGEYRCEASNECGNASETATIEVQCKYQFLGLNYLETKHGLLVGKAMYNSLGLVNSAVWLVKSVLCFPIGKFKFFLRKSLMTFKLQSCSVLYKNVISARNKQFSVKLQTWLSEENNTGQPRRN